MNICSLRGLRLQERLEKCLSLRNSQTVLGGELNIKEQDLPCEGGNCSSPGAQAKEQCVQPTGDSGACAEKVPSARPPGCAGMHRNKKSPCKGPELSNGLLAYGSWSPRIQDE